MYDNQTTAQEKQPDLVEILSSLREQNNFIERNVNQAYSYINKFKDFRIVNPLGAGELDSKEPQGIVEMLHYEINKMRAANDFLRQVNDAFASLVG